MPTATRFSRNSSDENRILIVAVDGFKGEVRAHFNPKEIQFDKTVTWQEHKATGHNEPYYEYTAGSPRTMSMELFFDAYELKDETVEPELQVLTRMSLAFDPQSKKKDERRPPMLKIQNGPIPNFQCVLESLIVKVTMFDSKMRAVRATANVKFKELYRGLEGCRQPNNTPGQDGKRPGVNWMAPTKEETDKASADRDAEWNKLANQNGYNQPRDKESGR